MSYFRYIPFKDKNTSIVFIDIQDLISNRDLLGKFKIHINEMHMRCFNTILAEDLQHLGSNTFVLAESLESLGTGLFVFATTQYVELNTEEDIAKYFLIDFPELISSMAILRQNNIAGQLWSVCSTIEGQTRKLARLIILQCQALLEYIELFVEYLNPYWDRAIGLYTSLGFKNPKDVLYQDRQLLLLKWDKDKVISGPVDPFDINEDPEDPLATCNKIKIDWSIGHGYTVSLLRFTNSQLHIFNQILEKNREYGGALGVEPTFSSRTFDLVSLNSFYTGNYIIQPNKIETTTNTNMMYSFHTHPINASNMNRLAISCPSTIDLVLVLRAYKTKNYKHFVMEPDGIWTIQVDPRSMKYAMNIRDQEYEIIYTKYEQLYFELQNNLDKEIDDSSIYKNALINNYLANISSVTWKSLALRDDNVPILLVNFYPWKFIKNQIDSTGYWTDWTFYTSFSRRPVLKGRNDLVLNFDFDRFVPILDAIDHVGGLNVGNDELMMNTLITNNSEDFWFGRDLLPFMRRYNDTSLIERIYNGEIN